jgi:hypothetical protein
MRRSGGGASGGLDACTGGSLTASRKAAPSLVDVKLSGKVDDPGRADVFAGCNGGAEIASGGAGETVAAADAGAAAADPVAVAARGADARF